MHVRAVPHRVQPCLLVSFLIPHPAPLRTSLCVIAHAVALPCVAPLRSNDLRLQLYGPPSCDQTLPRLPAPLLQCILKSVLPTLHASPCPAMPRRAPACPALPAPQNPTPCVPRGARPRCSTPCAIARLRVYNCMARASGSPSSPIPHRVSSLSQSIAHTPTHSSSRLSRALSIGTFTCLTPLSGL